MSDSEQFSIIETQGALSQLIHSAMCSGFIATFYDPEKRHNQTLEPGICASGTWATWHQPRFGRSKILQWQPGELQRWDASLLAGSWKSWGCSGAMAADSPDHRRGECRTPVAHHLTTLKGSSPLLTEPKSGGAVMPTLYLDGALFVPRHCSRPAARKPVGWAMSFSPDSELSRKRWKCWSPW